MDFLPQNAAHWHTIIVHFPAFSLLFSAVLLLIAAALKEGRFQRVALLFIILTAVATMLTAKTGEEAEDIVEQLPGVEEHYIHDHEEAAEAVVFGAIGLGVIALIVLVVTAKQKVLSGKVVLLMLVLTLVVTGWLGYVAKLGGQIRHEENRPSFKGPSGWAGEMYYDDENEDEEEE